MRKPRQARAQQAILEAPLHGRAQIITVLQHIDPEQDRVEVELARERVGGGGAQGGQGDGQQALHGAAQVWAAQAVRVEVAGQELQHAQVRREQRRGGLPAPTERRAVRRRELFLEEERVFVPDPQSAIFSQRSDGGDGTAASH